MIQVDSTMSHLDLWQKQNRRIGRRGGSAKLILMLQRSDQLRQPSVDGRESGILWLAY